MRAGLLHITLQLANSLRVAMILCMNVDPLYMTFMIKFLPCK